MDSSLILTTQPELRTLLREEIRAALLELQPATEPDDILTLVGACAFLSLARPTLYALTSQRRIPHAKKGKRLYFRRSELLTWLAEGRQPTQKEIAANVLTSVAKKGGRS